MSKEDTNPATIIGLKSTLTVIVKDLSQRIT